MELCKPDEWLNKGSSLFPHALFNYFMLRAHTQGSLSSHSRHARHGFLTATAVVVWVAYLANPSPRKASHRELRISDTPYRKLENQNSA